MAFSQGPLTTLASSVTAIKKRLAKKGNLSLTNY